MNIYVAGSSLEVALIEEYMRRLRAAGHIITHDWTVPVRESAQIAQRDLTEADRWRHARADRQGVLDADIFWMLIPTTPSSGAWVELGIAAGGGRPGLSIVSGDWRRSIFTSLADQRFDTHAEAFAFIMDLDTHAGGTCPSDITELA